MAKPPDDHTIPDSNKILSYYFCFGADTQSKVNVKINKINKLIKFNLYCHPS